MVLVFTSGYRGMLVHKNKTCGRKFYPSHALLRLIKLYQIDRYEMFFLISEFESSNLFYVLQHVVIVVCFKGL